MSLNFSTASADSARSHGNARKTIPLDPTAEAALLKAEYERSRMERLLAVRAASNQYAANRLALHRQQQAARAEREARELEARREEQAAVERQRLEREYAAAQQKIGEAQRASSQLAQQKLQAEAEAARLSFEREQRAQLRFEAALNVVHEREGLKEARLRSTNAIKQKIKQNQILNRAELEKHEKLFAERHPSPLIEYAKVPLHPTTPRGAALAQAPYQSKLTIAASSSALRPNHHQQIPGGPSPQTPALSSASASPAIVQDDDEEEEPSLAPSAQIAIPTPHPHPSSVRKPATASSSPQSLNHHPLPHQTPRTPTVAVALNFTTPGFAERKEQIEAVMSQSAPIHESKEEEEQSQPQPQPETGAASRESIALAFHDKQMMNQRQRTRYNGGSSKPAVSANATLRKQQQKAFEIVLKKEGKIIAENIVVDQEVAENEIQAQPEGAPKSRSSKNNKSSSKKKTVVATTATSSSSSQKKIAKQSIISSTQSKKRKSVRSTVPILTPNAAFFEQNRTSQHPQESQIDQESTLLFHPHISTMSNKKNAVAWVIPAENKSSKSQPSAMVVMSGPSASSSSSSSPELAPVLRGMQLVQQHKAARAANSLVASEATHLLAKVEQQEASVEVGTRFYQQENNASQLIVERHEMEVNQEAAVTSKANEEKSDDLKSPGVSPGAPSSAAAVQSTPIRFNSDAELETALKQILRSHLKAEEEMVEQVRAACTPARIPLFTGIDNEVHERAALSDSDNDPSPGSVAHQQRHALFAFTSPQPSATFMSPGYMSSTSSSIKGTPASPVPAAFTAPTAETDLFLETINFYLEQEKLAAAQQEEENRRLQAAQLQLEQQQLAKQEASVKFQVSVQEAQAKEDDDEFDERSEIPGSRAPLIAWSAKKQSASPVSVATTQLVTPAKYSLYTIPATPASASAVHATPGRQDWSATFRNMTEEQFRSAQPTPQQLKQALPVSPAMSVIHTPARAAEASNVQRTLHEASNWNSPAGNDAARMEVERIQQKYQNMQHKFEQRMAH